MLIVSVITVMYVCQFVCVFSCSASPIQRAHTHTYTCLRLTHWVICCLKGHTGLNYYATIFRLKPWFSQTADTHLQKNTQSSYTMKWNNVRDYWFIFVVQKKFTCGKSTCGSAKFMCFDKSASKWHLRIYIWTSETRFLHFWWKCKWWRRGVSLIA